MRQGNGGNGNVSFWRRQNGLDMFESINVFAEFCVFPGSWKSISSDKLRAEAVCAFFSFKAPSPMAGFLGAIWKSEMVFQSLDGAS